MRIARKLFLLALAVGAFMAFGSATAAASVEVVEEGGAHCSNVLENNGGNPEFTGGCPIRTSGNDFELGALGGFIMIVCDIDLEGYAGETGHLEGNYTVVPNSCTGGNFHPCTVMAERHFEAQILDELDGNGRAPIEANFCLDFESPIAIGEAECHVEGTFLQVSHEDQRLEFNHSHECEDNPGLSFSGNIEVSPDPGHPPIEVVNVVQ